MSTIAVATKAIVKNEKGEYLILHKSSEEDINPNTYDLPGGRLNFGENLEQAVTREVKEETGLDIKVKKAINTWSFLKDKDFQLIGIDFLCELVGGEVKLSSEHDDLIWVTSDSLSLLNPPSWLTSTIQKAQDAIQI